MDGRDSITSYYLHRGLGGGLHGAQSIHQNPSPNFGGAHIGGGERGGGFQSESSVSRSVNVGEGNLGSGGGGDHGEVSVKRKRGRPRKYGPDGSISGGLLPLSGAPNANAGSVSGVSVSGGSGSGGYHGVKRGRGRPPGTGKNQLLASLGELVAGSAGTGFIPHVIMIEEGEDVVKKIMLFSQQGRRAVCILSANGAVSTVSLRQPASFGGTVTFEGRFEILCLSGSYMPTDEDGSHSRSGSLNISLSSPDGRVIGGSVGGLLIAATPVQVILGSFVYGGSKPKNKSKTDQKPETSGSEQEHHAMGNNNKQISSTMPNQNNQTFVMGGGWSGSRQQMDNMRNNTLDIDLTRG